MSGINSMIDERNTRTKRFEYEMRAITTILRDNPHLSLGDPMRGPFDSFSNGRWVADSKDTGVISLSPTLKMKIPHERFAPLQPAYDENSFTGAKYLHVYSVVHPFEDKVAWLTERYGQKIECINPETFDVTVIKIDEEVISRFNVLLVRYGLSS